MGPPSRPGDAGPTSLRRARRRTARTHVAVKELRDALEQLGVVLLAVETVPFIRLVQPVVGNASLVERSTHAIRTHRRHTFVLAADGEHDAGLEAIHLIHRRPR